MADKPKKKERERKMRFLEIHMTYDENDLSHPEAMEVAGEAIAGVLLDSIGDKDKTLRSSYVRKANGTVLGLAHTMRVRAYSELPAVRIDVPEGVAEMRAK